MFFVVDPDVELLVDYFFARDDLLLTSAKVCKISLNNTVINLYVLFVLHGFKLVVIICFCIQLINKQLPKNCRKRIHLLLYNSDYIYANSTDLRGSLPIF